MTVGFVDPDYCGAGLEVRFAPWSMADSGHPSTRQPGLLQAERPSTSTYTNLANGTDVTDDSRTVPSDLHVTDNGDGTLTILVLATGNFSVYGEDGKAIARNPGEVLELLVDHGGTRRSCDDVELDFTLVKESTGRSDDACEAAVATDLNPGHERTPSPPSDGVQWPDSTLTRLIGGSAPDHRSRANDRLEPRGQRDVM